MPPARISNIARNMLKCCSIISLLLLTYTHAGLHSLPMPGKFFGFNVPQWEDFGGNNWSDPMFTGNVTSTLQPGFIRYPGGTVANYWDWKRGGFFVDGRINWTASKVSWYAHQPYLPYTYTDLALACNATRATPIFVVNMLYSNLSYELAGLFAAKKAGLSVQYVELANEIYQSNDDLLRRWPTAADYAAEANEWAAAICSAFGDDVYVSAVSAYTDHSGHEAQRYWDFGSVSYRSSLDTRVIKGLTIHMYQGSGHHCQPKRGRGRGSWGNASAQQHQFDSFKSPGGVATLLDNARRTMQVLTDATDASTPPGLSIAVTEFNMYDTCGPIRQTWAHGLYVGIMAQRLLATPRVHHATLHALAGNPMFTALYTYNNTLGGLLLKDYPVPPYTQPYTPTAGGMVIAAANNAARGGGVGAGVGAGATTAQEVVFDANGHPDAHILARESNVTGVIFRASNQTSASVLGLFLINVGAQSHMLHLPTQWVPKSCMLRGSIITAVSGPTEWITSPASVHISLFNVTNSGSNENERERRQSLTLSVPAYAVLHAVKWC